MMDSSPPRPATAPSGVTLVTVARDFGSGGSDLARALGARLGWNVLEEGEIVRRVAERLGVPAREVAARDEHVATFAERVGDSLSGVFPEVVLAPRRPTVDTEKVADAAVAVLREAAERPPVVMVGHGGMCLFSERSDAVHVRVVAPVADRIDAVVRRLGMGEDAAAEEVAARDADRRAWIRRRFGVDADEPTLYHLVMDGARVRPDVGAELVEALVARLASR